MFLRSGGETTGHGCFCRAHGVMGPHQGDRGHPVPLTGRTGPEKVTAALGTDRSQGFSPSLPPSQDKPQYPPRIGSREGVGEERQGRLMEPKGSSPCLHGLGGEVEEIP